MKSDNPEVKNKEDKRLLQDKLRMNEMELKEAEEALHNFERIKSQWLADLISEAEVRQRLSNMGYLWRQGLVKTKYEKLKKAYVVFISQLK